MGQRTEAGWEVLQQAAVRGGLKYDSWYNVLLSVNGLTATLVVNNTTYFSYTYEATVVDGWSYGLNWGLVGFGSDQARGALDNIAVQVLPPVATVVRSDSFDNGSSGLLSTDAASRSGNWSVEATGKLKGVPQSVTEPEALQLLNLWGTTSLQVSALLQMEAKISTATEAGLVYDWYGDRDYKVVMLDFVKHEIQLGHVTASGYKVDASIAKADLTAEVEYKLAVTVKGSTVNVYVDGQIMLGFVYNAVAVDGRFGLLAKDGEAYFDDVTVKTDDASVDVPSFLTAASAAPTVNNDFTVLTESVLDPIVLEAKQRWLASGLVDAQGMAILDQLTIRFEDLDGLALAVEYDNLIILDIDAASWGWFVDETASEDEEFLSDGQAGLLAMNGSAAEGHMDLLTVISHEIGHALGYSHTDVEDGELSLMDATLKAGVREVPSDGVSYIDEDSGNVVATPTTVAPVREAPSDGVSYFDEDSGSFAATPRTVAPVRDKYDDFVFLTGQAIEDNGSSLSHWNAYDSDDDENSFVNKLKRVVGKLRKK